MSTRVEATQLELGESVTAEKRIITGIVKKGSPAVVLKKYGSRGMLPCKARIGQDTIIEAVGQLRSRRPSRWITLAETNANRTIRGIREEWPIPKGSPIMVLPEKIGKIQTKIVPIVKQELTIS